LNDLLTPQFGESAIRYSLAVMFLGALGATTTALLSTRWLRADFERTQQEFVPTPAAA
jgi:hypothetical protein